MLFYHLYLLPLPAFTLLLMSIRLQRYPIVVFVVDDIAVDGGAAIAASAANPGGTAVAAFLPAAIPIGKPAL